MKNIGSKIMFVLVYVAIALVIGTVIHWVGDTGPFRPAPVRVGETYCEVKENPFDSARCVIVLAVKEDWVKFQFTQTQTTSTRLKIFHRLYPKQEHVYAGTYFRGIPND